MSGTGLDPDDVLRAGSSQQTQAEDRRRSIEDDIQRQESRDRSVVTGTVLTVFFVSVPLALIALLLLSFLSKEAAPEAIKATADILKSVLLPTMTLVLGYYFGRGGKS